VINCAGCNSPNYETDIYCKNCGDLLKKRLTRERLVGQRYKVISPLKVGGMSGVYMAKDTRLNSTCAVKELLIKMYSDSDRDSTIQNFKAEAELLANLRHPSLPRVIDYFYEDGKYYLVMDYIEGDDLESVLEQEGIPWLPEKDVMTWALEICDVLSYLHNQSPPIIYRDLKPSNIMLRKSDQKLMLIDFGLAQMVHLRPLGGEKALGTPGYAPPEQYSGREEPRSDIYAMGATLHHLLTGTPPGTPFKFAPIRELNRDVSPDMERIVIKSLQRDIDMRYNTVSEMKKELIRLADTLGIPRETKRLDYYPAEKIPITGDNRFITPVIEEKKVKKKRIKIFLVEDDKIIRKMLKIYMDLSDDMELSGEAVNGADAIEQFRHLTTLPDITLMDISMPDVDGITATKEILKIAPKAKIIMLTALESTKEIVLQSFKAGAIGYIIKNTDMDEIAEYIRKAYHGGSPIEPTVASLLISEIVKSEK